MKTHLNLATTDLAKSVRFYSTLLDAQPAKLLNDYALFITERPGLELALDLRSSVSSASDVHYGICVDSIEEVEHAAARLQHAGLAPSTEREGTCCYANQSKIWAIDPVGRRWEIYTVHEDTEERDATPTTCCTAAADQSRSCCSNSAG
ncbi:MAG: ArsI/CadI family heavy metal resistance metalloenzyme [Candidatus Cybelea sp.]